MSAPQGTEAWRLDRCGRATASCFSDVLAKMKSGKGEAATRRNYKMRLVVERLTGIPQDTYSNKAMEWGSTHETEARSAFEDRSGLWVVQTGFVPHSELMAGCSPDGLIGRDEGFEAKCPFSSAVHVETLECGMPSDHTAQVQGCMWITGRKRWHFASYDPRMPAHLRLFHQVIERDEDYIDTLASEVVLFLGEVDLMHTALMRRAA